MSYQPETKDEVLADAIRALQHEGRNSTGLRGRFSSLKAIAETAYWRVRGAITQTFRRFTSRPR